MPLFLEPDQRFPIVLESDKDKPVESRPTFYAKSQSMRGIRKIAEVIDQMDSASNMDEMLRLILDELMDCLTGWTNMGSYEFSRVSLEIVLTYPEARELLRKVMANQHVQPEEKKS
jgi:hypothetical protein